MTTSAAGSKPSADRGARNTGRSCSGLSNPREERSQHDRHSQATPEDPTRNGNVAGCGLRLHGDKRAGMDCQSGEGENFPDAGDAHQVGRRSWARDNFEAKKRTVTFRGLCNQHDYCIAWSRGNSEMASIRKIINRRKKALASANPKKRDRLRYELRVAQVAAQLRKECAA